MQSERKHLMESGGCCLVGKEELQSGLSPEAGSLGSGSEGVGILLVASQTRSGMGSWGKQEEDTRKEVNGRARPLGSVWAWHGRHR